MRWLLWCASLAVVIAGAAIYYLGAGQRSVTAALRLIRYDEAVAAIDQLYEAHPLQPGTTSQHPSPASLSTCVRLLTDSPRFTQPQHAKTI